MSRVEQSTLVHDKIILGQPAGMTQYAHDPTLFFQKVLSDIGIYHGIPLVPISSGQVPIWGKPEVTSGCQSKYLVTPAETGHVVRFFGEGEGDLFFYDGNAQRHVGAITEASWAYIPHGKICYFYVTVAGALACECQDVVQLRNLT